MMAAAAWLCGLLSLLALAAAASAADGVEGEWEPLIRMPTEKEGDAAAASSAPAVEEDEVGTRWAVLVAGSSGYGNYRHQADVCHAYQILRKGGVEEENIVVFMYDDIAHNILNPRPGVIINHPKGENVYNCVPKDYTGDQVTTENFFAVLLGNKSAITGGSKKVIDSKPNDHIFIYYSDHGGPGVLGMPNLPYLYAGDFIKVLKKKHASNSYSKTVIYVEACESGSIFEGLMPEDLNIYVTTASNPVENSWGTYCPGMEPSPPPEYITCLGDLYSVSWMEDSQTHNLKKETIKDQYEVYEQLNGESVEKLRALIEIKETVQHRKHLDSSIDFIGRLVFGFEKGPSMLEAVRATGQPLVDDWDCLKRMVRIFESHCGSLTQYGMKYMRAFANICNSGISEMKMRESSISACSSYNSARWSPMAQGHSA